MAAARPRAKTQTMGEDEYTGDFSPQVEDAGMKNVYVMKLPTLTCTGHAANSQLKFRKRFKSIRCPCSAPPEATIVDIMMLLCFVLLMVMLLSLL